MAQGTHLAETQRTRRIRWSCAAILAIALHAGAALALLYARGDDDADPAGAVAIELAPNTAASALAPSEIALGPSMQEGAPAPETREQTKAKEEVLRVAPAPLAPEPTLQVPDPQPEKKAEVDDKFAPEQKSQQASAAPMTTAPPPAEAKISDAAVAPAAGLSAK